LEVVLNQNVLDLKNQIETQLSLGAAAAMKLIHHGKILKDDQVLSSIGLKEGDFVVLMTTKKKRQVKKANAETASNQPTQPPAATTSSSSNQPSSSATSNNANPDPPASNSNAQPMSGASALVPVSQVSAAVQNLVNMGFPEAECRAALAAAFNNPDRAVEYLINGIPESARRQQQAPPPSAAPLPGARPASATGAAPNTGAAPPQSSENVVQTIMQSLLQSPGLLQAILLAINNIRPQEYQAITQGFTGDRANPQQSLSRFAALLNDSEVLQHIVSFLLTTLSQRGPGGPGPGVQRVQVNPQELEQIQRLAETTNLSQEEALRIFLRAGRNAELAASLVFEAQASGNLGAFGAAPNANANQPAPAPNANANANPVQANANANAESNMEVEENNDAPDNANNGGDPAPDSGANSGDTS